MHQIWRKNFLKSVGKQRISYFRLERNVFLMVVPVVDYVVAIGLFEAKASITQVFSGNGEWFFVPVHIPITKPFFRKFAP